MGNKTRILFIGDISLYKIDFEHFEIDSKLQKIINCSDYIVGNLESPITDSQCKKKDQVINLFAPIKSLSIIRKLNAVSLANNHIQDFNQKGAEDTLNALREYSIHSFGLGNNYENALQPHCFILNGKNYAIFGSTRYANAKNNMLGTAPDNSKLLYKLIKEYKRKAYFVIVYYHWGYEYVRVPSPRERKLAHKAIDCGADFVVGSHPHVYQGIETYHNKTIAYSLGNFIFHSSVYTTLANTKDTNMMQNSFMVELIISGDNSYEYKIHGYKTLDNSIKLYSGEENKLLTKDILKISANLIESMSIAYLKEYYLQSSAISKQNAKARNDINKDGDMSIFKQLQIYRNANSQDVKNRIWGIIMKIMKLHNIDKE